MIAINREREREREKRESEREREKERERKREESKRKRERERERVGVSKVCRHICFTVILGWYWEVKKIQLCRLFIWCVEIHQDNSSKFSLGFPRTFHSIIFNLLNFHLKHLMVLKVNFISDRMILEFYKKNRWEEFYLYFLETCLHIHLTFVPTSGIQNF